MLRLFNEAYDREIAENLKYISDSKDNTNMYLKGPFMGAEKRNRNGRIYKHKIIERECNSFQSLIKNHESLGELDHPDSSAIDPKSSAILIEELQMDGNFAIGKAKVLHTPNGIIVSSLMRDDVRLGVSSRGVGDLDADNYVTENFKLITIDVVLQPSCQDAYVDAVNECYKWVLNEKTGLYVEKKEPKSDVVKGNELPDLTLDKATIKVVDDAAKVFKTTLDNGGSKKIKDAFIEFIKTISRPKSAKNWLE
jgi:hypothetical protein